MLPTDLLEEHFRISLDHKKALAKLQIQTVRDILYHFPTRYGDTAEVMNIASAEDGKEVIFWGTISHLSLKKAFKSRMTMAEATITDDTGSIKIVWFNQPYIAKMIQEGASVKVEGKVTERKGTLNLSNPKIETVVKLPTAVGDSLFGASDNEHTLYPVYPESRGVSSNWMYHTLQKIFKSGVLD